MSIHKDADVKITGNVVSSIAHNFGAAPRDVEKNTDSESTLLQKAHKKTRQEARKKQTSKQAAGDKSRKNESSKRKYSQEGSKKSKKTLPKLTKLANAIQAFIKRNKT